MKNILKITAILFAVLSCRVCYSQNKLAVGVRLLPSATTFRYNTGVPILDFLKVAPYHFRVRTTQGIGVLYNAGRKLSIGTDLLYSLEGGGYQQRKTNLNYLKLPIWIGYNSSPARKLIFTVQSGLEFSYLLQAKIRYDDKSIDIGRYVNKLSTGIPLAIGVKFRMFHSYAVSTQLYLSSEIGSLSKTNREFGVYNYVFPGLRISIDHSLKNNLK
ncbi:hypothetical protein DYBT9275_03866 [Dyadobacter sp. CECT 9275]|uniref:Outer membrane protein beta-barrel domain-containing protein n=1 Tax=Dyadobacter helix TaxID=2822344 RepID=A0A916N5S7_9BACT|nr:outer membrane beta-barrel protein [Dyadobacter sp. CECT 9275]CAG5006634.1 hypothetical protein DYBT9275_03866 [Dyadobacter sp. CECT 9275]